jgi:hypothetical protein
VAAGPRNVKDASRWTSEKIALLLTAGTNQEDGGKERTRTGRCRFE